MLPEKVWKERLKKEAGLLRQYPTFGSADKTLTTWHGYIAGDGPFAGETHEVRIELTRKFPFEPPQVTWLTDIFHPNIEPPQGMGGYGRVCLNLLDKDWTPMKHLPAIVEGLMYLLNNPNPEDALANPTCQEAKKKFERRRKKA